MPTWTLIAFLALTGILLGFTIWLWTARSSLATRVENLMNDVSNTREKLLNEQRALSVERAKSEALQGVIDRLDVQLSERNKAYVALSERVAKGELCSVADVADALRGLLP